MDASSLNGTVVDDDDIMAIDVDIKDVLIDDEKPNSSEVDEGRLLGGGPSGGDPDEGQDHTEPERRTSELDEVFSEALSDSPMKSSSSLLATVQLRDETATSVKAEIGCPQSPSPPPSTRGDSSPNSDASGGEGGRRRWIREGNHEEADTFYSNPDHVWQSIRRKAVGGVSSHLSTSSFQCDEARRTEEAAVAVKRLSVLAVKSAARHCRRSFAHYDGVSALTNLADSYGMSERSFNVNVQSGASAIGQGSADENSDLRGNDIVLAAPQFWNELGGDAGNRYGLKASGNVPLTFSPKSCRGVVLEVSLYHINGDEMERKRRRYCQLPMWRPFGGHQVQKDTQLHFDNFDLGALYYRHFFADNEHINLFSIDDGLGPVAISLRRETVEITGSTSHVVTELITNEASMPNPPYAPGGVRHQYRVIVRTARPSALRGTVSEDSIVAAGAQLRPTPNNPGVSVRDIISFVAPEVHLSSLRFGLTDQKVIETLLKLDEQGLCCQYKFGVVYCKASQCTEEEMYNNEDGSDTFYQFLDCLADKVELRGFKDYRGQLDNKNDSTGQHSYYGSFEGMEIMLHVSTLLPYTPNHKQQLLRKRHIGNDIVTIVFQEEDALPFTPACVRSQFQHVFIVVRCIAPCPETGKPRYRLAVSQAKDVPPFGPPLPAEPVFTAGQELRHFLLTKLINAENAAHTCPKFANMSTRTRFEYLSSLANDCSSNQGLENSSGSGLLSRLKKQLSSDRNKSASLPMATTVDLLHLPGAMVWPVLVTNWGLGLEEHHCECLLSISHAGVAFLDPESRLVRCYIPPDYVAGWVAEGRAARILYRGNAFVSFTANSGAILSDEAVAEIVVRLNACTKGASAIEITLKKEGDADHGFLVHSDGVVSEVTEDLPGYQAGIRTGCRIIDMDGVPVYGQPMEEVVTHLREALCIRAMIIPPTMDCSPRGGRLSRHSSISSAAGYDPSSSPASNYLTTPRNSYNGRISPSVEQSGGSGSGLGRRQSQRRKIPVGEKWMQEVLNSVGSKPRQRAQSIDSPSLRGVVRKAKDKLAAKTSSPGVPSASPLPRRAMTPTTTVVPSMSD